MSTMVKSEDDKFVEPMIVGQVKLSNDFEDQKPPPLSIEETEEETSRGKTISEKTGNLINFLFIESKNDNADDQVWKAY